MYELKINGSYRGSYKTPAEAMVEVDRSARPYKASWVILDPYKKVYAQG